MHTHCVFHPPEMLVIIFKCDRGMCQLPVFPGFDRCSYLLQSDSTMLGFHRDFLPRGSGIVTRRPLVLQLISSNAGGCTTPPHPHPHPETHKHKYQIFLVILIRSVLTLSSVAIILLTVVTWCSSCQSGLSFFTARAKSSPTSMRFVRRSSQRQIGSQGPTKEYLQSPSTCGFIPLMVLVYTSY